MSLKEKLAEILAKHKAVLDNISRKELISEVVNNKEAVVTETGSLATWAPAESTGRSPKDTYIVKRKESEKNIDWNSPNNNPLDPEVFDQLFDDALAVISKKKKIYVTDRVLGAATKYALPVKVVSDRAISALFTDNMFRPRPEDIAKSVFYHDGFTLLALPYDKVDSSKYEGKLREIDGKTSNIVVAVDMDQKLALVYGSAYCGSIKKTMFTVMNYVLPEKGVLPLHCGANEDKDGNTTLFLGLSGTGKTTLSTDSGRKLIGDDEHWWAEDGIANFEYGCYAKLINIDPKKEPEIFKAVFDKRHPMEDGTIIENAMMYPDGTFDLNDDRLTPNSRVSYPLRFLNNVKETGLADHPKTIIFLTADANGVIPPIAKLTPAQAMLWFLMGYTSKLAGTETGVVDPVSAFSRFFGEPFMPRNPNDYSSMLGEKIKEHKTKVFLINTGWSGGPFGVGERIDIITSRKMIDAALTGQLNDVEYEEDKRFHILVPKTCPGIDSKILNPKNTWDDKVEYKKRADKLASEFSVHFNKAYGQSNIDQEVKNQCPGK